MLNWLARYAPAGAAILDADGRARGQPARRRLGPHGFACAHPDVPFVGLDVEFAAKVAPSMTAIQAPAWAAAVPRRRLPHRALTRHSRARATARPGRVRRRALPVAAHRVLLACPTSEAAGIDTAIRARFTAMGVGVPFVAERAPGSTGCRRARRSRRSPPTCRASRSARGRWPTACSPPCSPGPTCSSSAPRRTASSLQHREEWVRLLESADFGTSFRGGWVLERTSPVTPLIGVDRLADDAVTALRCLVCGAGHERQGGRRPLHRLRSRRRAHAPERLEPRQPAGRRAAGPYVGGPRQLASRPRRLHQDRRRGRDALPRRRDDEHLVRRDRRRGPGGPAKSWPATLRSPTSCCSPPASPRRRPRASAPSTSSPPRSSRAGRRARARRPRATRQQASRARPRRSARAADPGRPRGRPCSSLP